MNEFWNLDPIYSGFEDPQFALDLSDLKEKVAEAACFAAGLETMDPIAGLRGGIALEERVQELANKLGEYASLRQSANTRDAEAGSRLGQVMAVISGFAAPMAALPWRLLPPAWNWWRATRS